MNRREYLSRVGALPLLWAGVDARADTYPSKAIRWVVPHAAGSPIDAIGRKLAEIMSAQLGVPIIVDNKPGASGSIGATEVARAPRDGYTLMLSVADPLIFAPAMMKVTYDAKKDFQPIAKVAAIGPVLLGSTRLKANNLRELIQEAKASAVPLTYGSNGPGSSPQQVMETFAKDAGIRLNEIPYKGAAQTLPATISGELDLSFTAPAQAAPMLASGRVKAIAVIGDKRNAVLPDVGTFVEAGFPSFVYRNKVWIGFTGPAGMPPDTVQQIFRSVQSAASGAEFQRYLEQAGFDLAILPPEQFRAEFQEEESVVLPMLQALGVKPQ